MPLHIVNHPLIHDALMELRDVTTPPPEFRRADGVPAFSFMAHNL